MADWTGNSNSIYKTLGASNHTDKERQNEDFYATEPKAAKLLLELETFSPNIWECACGDGSLSKVFESAGYNVKSTDLVDRGFGENGIDFLNSQTEWNGDIITNPPYKYGKEFVEKAMELIPEGKKVAMFLKLTFLEGQKRRKMFEKYPMKKVYVFSARKKCALNGDFNAKEGSAIAYAWFVWEIGYTGKPIIDWI